MDKFLVSLCFVMAFGMVVLVFPDGMTALALVAMLSATALIIFRKFTDEKQFITNVFLAALLVRIGFGIMIQLFDWREFFGADALTYDSRAAQIIGVWFGRIPATDAVAQSAMMMSGTGWGMNYLVAILYFIFGKNIFLAQSFCAVFGAAAAPMVYFCAKKIFQNIKAAKISALAIALFPSFIIWSGQLMKDGLIIFLLVLAMTMVLQLQERFNYTAILLLLFSIFGIMTLRFYIFYMVLVAVAGSFLIGTSNSIQSIARRSLALILLGLGLTYFGVIRTASVDLGTFGSLEAVQRSRLDLASSAKSGFGSDLDVSTAGGAIAAVPVGFIYLMLAPFPWQVTNWRQAITLPEVLVWWSMMPLMISGLWYSLRYKLRKGFPILIFTLTLTLAYSIFQGNVGTAYRQRTQIQVFMFIFIAVGWVLYKEKRENLQFERRQKRQMFEASLKAGLIDH